MNKAARIVNTQQACTIVAGLLWFVAIMLSVSSLVPPVYTRLLYSVTIALSAVRMLRPVWNSLRKLSLDMNLLMAAAVIGALFLGEWAEGALILLLFALADWIEDKSMARTSRAIESLMQLAPDRVRYLHPDETETLVPPEEVPTGSRLRLQPGERVGLDARILSGMSQIMQAQVTGEPLPVDVAPGDTVSAGSINGNGALLLETIRPAGESTVARIIKLVQEARQTKAPMQKTVERFAIHYTPLVFATAILLTAIPVLLFQQPLHIWGYRSLVILLVGCPCAFIIATPVTLVSGLTVAAHRGILIKGGAALEQAARIQAMIFDKTGTLTTGKPTVQKIIILPGHTQQEVLGTAAAISSQSGHVLGNALHEHCIHAEINIPKAEAITLEPGFGAKGTLNGKIALVGRLEVFTKLGVQIPPDLTANFAALQKAGYALVAVGTPEKLYGVIGLADKTRPEASTALRQLKALGLKHLALLSGDHQEAVDKLAVDLPLDTACGECMPDAKLRAMHALQKQYGLTAMIGDGINDAPALAGADLGIAMGAGADQALETADIALITDDISALPVLLHIARKTTRRVKVNIALALALKFAFLGLASVGFASLWMAVLADTGASLIVITSGLSLLREKIPGECGSRDTRKEKRLDQPTTRRNH